MAFCDFWEIESTADIWPLMVGKDAEDSDETQYQVGVILSGISNGNRALEVGCGVGRLMKEIAGLDHFTQVLGVDSSMSLVYAGEKYLSERQWNPPEFRPRIDLTDGVSLPYPDNYFDFVYSFTCFQHMISLALIHRNIREIRRVLTVGGLCRIQTISSNGDDPRDLKTYDGRVFRSADEFAEQFRAVGLEIVTVAEGLTHPKHIWVTARKTI